MTIYMATTLAGRGVWHNIVCEFKNKADLLNYASEVLSCTGTDVYASDSIDDICDKLYDEGPGTGSRSHRRISRRDAQAVIRAGARNETWHIRAA